MGMQSIQEALCNHWYRAFMKRALQDGTAAAPVLREVSIIRMLKISSHPIGGFISFFSRTLVLLNNDAQKAKSSFLFKEQGR
jgi:hypothetical protein